MKYKIGDKVRTVEQLDAVPLESVPIRSVGIIERHGEGQYQSGYFVRFTDKVYQTEMTYFCEPYQITAFDWVAAGNY